MAVSIGGIGAIHYPSLSKPTNPTLFPPSVHLPTSLLYSPSVYLPPHLSKPPSKPQFLTICSMEAGIEVLGTKLGMMTYFELDGKVVPVTVVSFREGNIVTQVKTEATDGYDAVQVGYRRVRDKKLTMPEIGHLNKIGAIPICQQQEFRLTSIEGFDPNQRLKVEELFQEGDLVDVAGTTIGKGFKDCCFGICRLGLVSARRSSLPNFQRILASELAIRA